MERGEIVLVSLDPAVGSEQAKTRPAVVVSSNAANNAAERRGRGVITIVPLTANISSIYAFQVLLRPSDTGLAVDSKAQAEQVRSIATERVVRSMGHVNAEKMTELDDALRLHLTL